MDKFDIAIVGSNLTAALTATLLERVHGLRVVLVGDEAAPYRSIYRDNFDFPFSINPHLFAALSENRGEALRWIRQIGGRKAVEAGSIELAMVSEDGAAALDHVAQLASHYGIESETTPIINRGGTGTNAMLAGRIVRGVNRVHSQNLWPKLFGQFESGDAQLLDVRHTRLEEKDSAYLLRTSGTTARAERLILIEDGIASAVGQVEAACPFELHEETLVAAQGRRLRSRVQLVPELALASTVNRNGWWHVAVSATRAEAPDLIRQIVPRFPTGTISAIRQKHRIVSHNGGLIFHRFGERGNLAIGNLRDTGIFLAPAIARLASDHTTDSDHGLMSGASDLIVPARKPGAV